MCVLSFGDRNKEMTMNESFLYIIRIPNGSSMARKAILFLINRPLANLIFSSLMLEALNEVLW